jgi:hypothetical protein
VVEAVAMRLIEPGSREGLLFDLAFALRHHVPRGVLKKIGTERHVRPDQIESLDEKIAAEAILEHLALCGWEITKRPDAGSKCGTTPGGPGGRREMSPAREVVR